MHAGDTFFIPTPDNPIRHPWIVLTDPDPDGRAVCVNVTSLGDHIADTTVVLDTGDHPFIEKRSVVLYAKAAMLDLRAIDAMLSLPGSRTTWKRFDSCSPDLLERVRRGLLASKHTKRAIKGYCQTLWNR